MTIHVLDVFGPVPYVLERLGSAAHGIYMSFTDTPPQRLRPQPRGRALRRATSATSTTRFPTCSPPPRRRSRCSTAIARSDGTRRSVLARLRATKVEDGILGSFRLDPFGDIDPGRIPIFRITGRNAPGEPVYESFEGAVVDRVIMVPSS